MIGIDRRRLPGSRAADAGTALPGGASAGAMAEAKKRVNRFYRI